MARALLILFVLTAALKAQPLRVFSEFARIGADGEPTAPENPREILSPAVPRNGFTTFQVVVKPGAGKTGTLWIGQNPENSFRVNLYREQGGKLVPTQEPVEIKGTEVIWLDMWVDRSTLVSRIKLEPELYLDQDWVIYPMEVRVVEAIIPDGSRPSGSAPAMDAIRSFVCGSKVEIARTQPLTPAGLIFRNAQADVALAKEAPKAELQKVVGPCDQPAPANPEASLRIRDYLLRMR
jgi:hypothetical protein